MIIETKYLGKQDIKEDKIIAFEKGIPGFEDEKKFVILDIPENGVLQMMQSIQTPNLAFFVTSPHYFYREYQFNLDEGMVQALQINSEKDVVIFVIMSIQEPFEKSTINLKAPVVINSAEKLGKQFILNDERYPLKATIQRSGQGSGG